MTTVYWRYLLNTDSAHVDAGIRRSQGGPMTNHAGEFRVIENARLAAIDAEVKRLRAEAIQLRAEATRYRVLADRFRAALQQMQAAATATIQVHDERGHIAPPPLYTAGYPMEDIDEYAGLDFQPIRRPRPEDPEPEVRVTDTGGYATVADDPSIEA